MAVMVMLLLLVGLGAFLVSFVRLQGDHQALRREVAELRAEQDFLLEIVSTAVAMTPADADRVARMDRRRRRLGRADGEVGEVAG
ncbi:MAG: hypothetical protein H0U67_00260 [Gemmatimonadetes bacterium]|nr:hypothetical protein [Gemmatimonadota bacterium]